MVTNIMTDRLKRNGDMLDAFKASVIWIIGVGGIGWYVMEYLDCMLEGRILVLIDADIFKIHNFNRIHLPPEDVGRTKVKVAAERVYYNEAKPFNLRVESELDMNMVATMHPPDYVVCCVDNTKSRMIVEKWCEDKSVPMRHAGAEYHIFSATEKMPPPMVNEDGSLRMIDGYERETAPVIPVAMAAGLCVANIFGYDIEQIPNEPVFLIKKNGVWVKEGFGAVEMELMRGE